jgi:hypothetical protein
LLGQRVVVAFLGCGFGNFAQHPTVVGHAHGHLGAAYVYARQCRAALGQLDVGYMEWVIHLSSSVVLL